MNEETQKLCKIKYAQPVWAKKNKDCQPKSKTIEKRLEAEEVNQRW